MQYASPAPAALPAAPAVVKLEEEPVESPPGPAAPGERAGSHGPHSCPSPGQLSPTRQGEGGSAPSATALEPLAPSVVWPGPHCNPLTAASAAAAAEALFAARGYPGTADTELAAAQGVQQPPGLAGGAGAQTLQHHPAGETSQPPPLLPQPPQQFSVQNGGAEPPAQPQPHRSPSRQPQTKMAASAAAAVPAALRARVRPGGKSAASAAAAAQRRKAVRAAPGEGTTGKHAADSASGSSSCGESGDIDVVGQPAGEEGESDLLQLLQRPRKRQRRQKKDGGSEGGGSGGGRGGGRGSKSSGTAFARKGPRVCKRPDGGVQWSAQWSVKGAHRSELPLPFPVLQHLEVSLRELVGPWQSTRSGFHTSRFTMVLAVFRSGLQLVMLMRYCGA